MSRADELFLQMKWNFMSKYNQGQTTEKENEIARQMGWIK